MYDQITWEYLAGFTDGEGNFAIVGRGPRVTWGQKDKGMMDALVNFLKNHRFHPLHYFVKPKPPRNPNGFFLCTLGRRAEVLRLMNILEPLMILKPPQCRVVRKWMDDHPANQNYDSIDINLVRGWIREGLSANWMAQMLGCERQKIYKYAKKAAIGTG